MSAPAETIWRNGRFERDEWTRYTPDAAILPNNRGVLVPYATFIAEAERFISGEGPLGVEVGAGESVRTLEPYLWKLSLIAVAFPKFSDGRSYSAARLLREGLFFRGYFRERVLLLVYMLVVLV
jgi:phosphoadenosine phosphosulfate reductase